MIDLVEMVIIPDKRLKAAIKNALSLSEEEITSEDMLKLTSLHAEGKRITNLEGLQSAVNLRELQLDNNEICDISVLGNLKALKTVSVKEQFIVVGLAKIIGEKVVITENIKTMDGTVLKPYKVMVGNFLKSKVVTPCMENETITFSTKELYSGTNRISIRYESEDAVYSAFTYYMITNEE